MESWSEGSAASVGVELWRIDFTGVVEGPMAMGDGIIVVRDEEGRGGVLIA